MRRHRAIAELAQDARQAGHVAQHAELELDRDLVDREAAQHLELGIGGLAAERGAEALGVVGLGPQRAEARIERIGAVARAGQHRRVPEALLQDDVEVAPVAERHQRFHAAGGRGAALDRGQHLFLGRHRTADRQGAQRFLRQMQRAAAPDEILALVPGGVAEELVEAAAERAGIAGGTERQGDQQRPARLGRPRAKLQVEEQQADQEGEWQCNGDPAEGAQDLDQGAQIVNIFRHDRPAKHRDLERARHIEQGEIERLQQQERPDPARDREHQQRQQQIEPEIIGYARLDDLDPERRPAREIGDGVEHGGRNDRHRPLPAGQNPPVLHLSLCHESGFPQPRSL